MSTNTKGTIQKKERNIHSKNKSRVCFTKILTVKIALSRPHIAQILSQEELRPFLNSKNSTFVIETDCVHSVIDMSVSHDDVKRTSLFRSKWMLFENLYNTDSQCKKCYSSTVRYDQRKLVVQHRKREKGRFVKMALSADRLGI